MSPEQSSSPQELDNMEEKQPQPQLDAPKNEDIFVDMPSLPDHSEGVRWSSVQREAERVLKALFAQHHIEPKENKRRNVDTEDGRPGSPELKIIERIDFDSLEFTTSQGYKVTISDLYRIVGARHRNAVSGRIFVQRGKTAITISREENGKISILVNGELLDQAVAEELAPELFALLKHIEDGFAGERA